MNLPNLKKTVLACLFLQLISCICFAEELRVVVAEGIGVSAQKATQNAAYNAMLQTVGVVIDAKTQAEQRSVIREGILEQSERFSSSVSEYSQGFLQSLTILEVVERDGLFSVTAEATIRMKAFSTYLQKFAKGETAIDGSGLFATIQNRIDQKKGLWELLLPWLDKIKKGQVQEIEVGRPQLASDVWEELVDMYPETLRNFKVGAQYKSFPENELGLLDEAIVYIPVLINLNKAFLVEFEEFLDGIAMERLSDSDVNQSTHGIYTSEKASLTNKKMLAISQSTNASDLMIALKGWNYENFNIYILSQLSSPASHWAWPETKNSLVSSDLYKDTKLVLTVKNGKSENLFQYTLQQEHYLEDWDPIKLVVGNSHYNHLSRSSPIFVLNPMPDNSYWRAPPSPWLQISDFSWDNNVRDGYRPFFVIHPTLKLGLLLRLPIQVLAEAQSIEIQLQSGR